MFMARNNCTVCTRRVKFAEQLPRLLFIRIRYFKLQKALSESRKLVFIEAYLIYISLL